MQTFSLLVARLAVFPLLLAACAGDSEGMTYTEPLGGASEDAGGAGASTSDRDGRAGVGSSAADGGAAGSIAAADGGVEGHAGVGGGDAPAADGGTSGDAECAPSTITGDQVVFIGDSFIAAPTSAIAPNLGALFMQEGSSAYSATPRYHQLVGTTMAQIAEQYATAHAQAPDIKAVIMDGGGNDVLLYNQQCLGDGAAMDAGCRMVADTATAVAKEMMMDMKAIGVSDVLYFFYPHVPAGGQDLMDNYAGPLAKKNCEEGSDATYRCHFVSLVEAFEGHADYIGADGIHPTAAGADAQANVVWDAMKKNCMAQGSGCCM